MVKYTTLPEEFPRAKPEGTRKKEIPLYFKIVILKWPKVF